MAKQTLLWTVLPNGQRGGRWCVSVVISPRLEPASTAERLLGHAAWGAWADWPATVAGLKLELQLPNGTVPLQPFIASPQLKPDSALWKQLFPADLPVAPFTFVDISAKNLRSFPVRSVLGLLRQHYTHLAQTAGDGDHPLLLPWRQADPALKGLLSDLGTRTQKLNFGERSIEVPLPGFGRFHAVNGGSRAHDRNVDRGVFTADSCIPAPARLPGQKGGTTTFRLRALPPVWEDPAQIRNGTIVTAPADKEKRAQLMEQFSGPGEYALWQSDRFYNRRVPTLDQQKMRRPGFTGVEAAPAEPDYDFHQRIASYGDHPHLMRRLGLVIDFVLEKNDLLDALITAAGAAAATGFMQLRIVNGVNVGVGGDSQRPWTAFTATRKRFVVRERTEDHADGLLRLIGASDNYLQTRSPFDVYQVDPDGAALKTVNFLLTAQNLVSKHLELGAHGAVTYTTGDRQPVANLRSGGIGVSRHGRAGSVGMNAATAALNNAAIKAGGAAAAAVTLFAEDVLRGYRIDAWDGVDARWRSLVQRQGAFRALARGALPERTVDLPADEGHVKGASATASPGAPDDQYLHETLFRWTGWSLAAPRPGRTLRSSEVPGTHLQTEEVVDTPTDTATRGNGLAVAVVPVKGSLPRLRFGRHYRLRARLVDLAGNSLALDEPGADEQASEALAYGRFEPVDPPALVLTAKVSEGESLERQVLRSNFDKDAAGYVAQIQGPLAGFYNNPDFEYGSSSDRHIVPPKSSQQQCELHGMFDAAIGSTVPARIKDGYAIAARENGSLLHPTPGTDIQLVTPAKAAQAATVTSGQIAPPEQADDTKDRFAAGQYLVHREAIVPVPYLPDPASGGVAIEGVPGLVKWIAGKPLVQLAPGLHGYVLDKGARAVFLDDHKDRLILLLDFDRDPANGALAKTWPDDTRSLRLQLHEQPGEVAIPPCGDDFTAADAPQWDFAKGVLRVFLPKGHVARLRYASFVHDELVSHLALPRWQPSPAGAQRLQAQAMAGVNWMLTPWRDLTFVHATQQPVCEPRADAASVMRQVGWQHADLRARTVRLHGPSTGKFEIVGEWEEWVDDPLADDPLDPGPKRVPHQAVLSEIRLGEMHGNRFSLEQAIEEQTAFTPVGGQLTPADLAKHPAVPGNRHEFGDTKFRFIRYHLRATTRFREYLPPSLFAEIPRITRDGPVVETHRVQIQAHALLGVDQDAGAPIEDVGSGGTVGTVIAASAPPDLPSVLYVVPTFRWDRSVRGRSQRLGNGLRVYLERPWFSSGNGELLGVVLQPNNGKFADLPAERIPYLTQWGRDPLWDSPIAGDVASANAFGAAVHTEQVLLLEDNQPVTIAGHRVFFDKQRKLWYCDIELNTGASYTPFVRLSLVRFQPHALEGAKISRTVLCDFAQVLPRRVATLERTRNSLKLDVYGSAPKRGPMRRVNPGGMTEGPDANVSVISDFTGPNLDDGRNRMEAVLQRQPTELDGDLGWEDVTVLGSSLVGGDAASRSLAVKALEAPAPKRASAAVTRTTRGGATLRFDRLEELKPVHGLIKDVVIGPVGPIGPIGPIGPGPFIEQPIWSQACTLPGLPDGWRYRVLLREFERYYTDKTVPDPRNSGWRKLLVEERLTYAETFGV
ncbi:hypothetical protein J2X20_001966 [Pelomonas saccharophila]|uniref:Uncharacterized protein n=1 Tax=Roseateles saccharophilus TaxID=304 RepID=A0ABU1YKF6_ROSSA|nr:hypothetical protein [Roseateles saccharophilus]MDR7269337.1 hypothetical protein [Roseateles saccharophilus]